MGLHRGESGSGATDVEAVFSDLDNLRHSRQPILRDSVEKAVVDFILLCSSRFDRLGKVMSVPRVQPDKR